ncbi:Na+/H+ antiporter NhaC family protein [Glaciecola sp. KUL10]|uniref:Na+/H+ antiporter NhaC family protein n=1 Tax=Glaciecola sp. (strain KUL10) TaxID=2161813 RepID=UPI000D783B45|nr:Na+/H+ antiporter NhaC family protein [Glaciecola sp. KUL10]GBL03914.1 Na+/H+ antiporter family protein [Glaciecola sp. KUL10]
MDWLSILPPLIAIAVVLWKKEVILALLLAVFSSELLLILNQGATTASVFLAPVNTVDRLISTVGEAGNARILIFSLLVGALLAFMRDSGGVTATVNKLINSGIARSKRKVGGITMFTGIIVFIESNLSILSSGILARGLFDKYKMSRARLAYVIDSTCAPICILILLNGWGAYILALVSNYQTEQSAFEILWGTLPYNIYAWLTVLVVAYTIFSDKVHGPMRAAESALESIDTELNAASPTKSRFMLLPLAVMIIGMLGFMLWTGGGDITKGSGSRSVLYATFLAIIIGYFQLLWHKRFDHQQSVKIGFKGMSELLPLVTIVMLSIALGASLKVLGTGLFVSSIVGEYLPTFLIIPMLFIAGAIISFTTGTSWGTFAILIPIGMPLVSSLGLPPSLVLAAILGGGIFGDHCSPISDTTAVSSLAAGCDLLTHVKTQLPYALFVGSVTVVSYIFIGLLL